MRASETRTPGVIYTQEWVVDFMLDLIGYDSSHRLADGLIVDPGCGDGAFTTRIVLRLLESAASSDVEVATLGHCLRAYDIDPEALGNAARRALSVLLNAGVQPDVANRLCEEWFVLGDFLLTGLVPQSARWVVGNPPYVRIEDAGADSHRHRRRWATMTGRADVYVGFFQAGIELLEDEGQIAFICADRWMHNQYGTRLRSLVTERTEIKLILELHTADVFTEQVSAYPAITVFSRTRTREEPVLAIASQDFGAADAAELFRWMRTEAGELVGVSVTAARFNPRALGPRPWPSASPEDLRFIAQLEASLPNLTEVGVQIRVGVATGADRVFIVMDTPPEVEPDRLVRAIGPSDIVDGQLRWTGRHMVNPWKDGELVDLGNYPGLNTYLGAHRSTLESRYIAKKHPERWWRTIDRPIRSQFDEPKLVVADINDCIDPVLDLSGAWPMHSAYFITSDVWDLEVLGGYLLSDVAAAFVRAYSVKMANGHLRISGQYLGTIRVPHYDNIGASVRCALRDAFLSRDRDAASAAARTLVADVETLAS